MPLSAPSDMAKLVNYIYNSLKPYDLKIKSLNPKKAEIISKRTFMLGEKKGQNGNTVYAMQCSCWVFRRRGGDKGVKSVQFKRLKSFHKPPSKRSLNHVSKTIKTMLNPQKFKHCIQIGSVITRLLRLCLYIYWRIRQLWSLPDVQQGDLQSFNQLSKKQKDRRRGSRVVIKSEEMNCVLILILVELYVRFWCP